ncbi:YibE/F family protein [Patescibacteria group bacterium]|nr:YibE/F family protein [Patescibacteria group bacterium]
MKAKYLFLLPVLLLVPFLAMGQEYLEIQDEILNAKVIEILDAKDTTREDGSISIQQKLKLEGLTGDLKGQTFEFDGMLYDVVSANEYHEGDKVIVSRTSDFEGNEIFYVTDYVRQGKLYWLALIFALFVILIGKQKGIRALVVLVLTFVVILKFIIPQILDGKNPLWISIIGALFILFLAIYITEGLARKSHIAVISILISLVITGFLAQWFTSLTKLTGFGSDEAMYLIGTVGGNINIQGLLLAGMIIGALGVLDDVVISQVNIVDELSKINVQLNRVEIYKRAMRVGISHMAAMVNTLFLAYAGASLPLLILFSINEPPFITFSQVLNNEMIATEIVRTITGSIGLILAIPISTILAIYFIKGNKKEAPKLPAVESSND